MTIPFKDIAIGQYFYYNGSEYKKRSSRTAGLVETSRVFYFNNGLKVIPKEQTITRYKLTTQALTTRDTNWKLGEWQEAKGEGSELCSSGLLHHYEHPLLAVFFNPIHANINNPRLFQIEASEELANNGTKGGSKRQRLVKKLPIPTLTTNQRVYAAILITQRLTATSCEWANWATNWLNRDNRTEIAADAAYTTVTDDSAAAVACAAAACAAAAWAAVDATWAAVAAVAADSAAATAAAWAAVDATDAAYATATILECLQEAIQKEVA